MNIHTQLLIAILLIQFLPVVNAQSSLGTIIDNTNMALPTSYNWSEYVFPEPEEQGICDGSSNQTATVEGVYFSQMHRHDLNHPFFFLVGYRPALFQIAISGQGSSPDVSVTGNLAGNTLGTLCLAGPEILQEDVDFSIPNLDHYFSVTLPKSWVQPGLELHIVAGDSIFSLGGADLKIGPYTEVNLVMFELDVLDYNTDPHRWTIIDRFLEETASAIPASVVRYGTFPERLPFPEIIASNNTEELVRLSSRQQMPTNGINSDGSINSIATLFMTNLHVSTGDFLSTVYFGNTLNLAPGGWGGGKSFVSFDFDDVYIHEFGHALSLPHWGDFYEINNPDSYQFLYPYGGENGNGGGRGDAWNFIQDIQEFINPICQYDERGKAGIETSDAMQRNNHCFGQRISGRGPWDGFGDFSAMAMHRYLVGGPVETGQVLYRGEMRDYQFNMQTGHPTVSLDNGKRVYKRDPLQNQSLQYQEFVSVPGLEQLNQDVYLIYGTAHETQAQANIVYKPIKFKGTLPPILDPTNPAQMTEMRTAPVYRDLLGSPRDITLKMTYVDGSTLHAVNPYHSYTRTRDYQGDFGIWRYDLCNFGLVVPGTKELVKVELFHRPLILRDAQDTITGNLLDPLQNITAENFMQGAKFQAEYVFGQPQALGSNSLGNRVWHDLNRNGLDDFAEPGIPGVTLLLWSDSDADGIPDSEGFGGSTQTDAEGHYSFTGLNPGTYIVFVWFLENWEEGQPLHGMVSSGFHSDPNNDINGDNNGRPGDQEFPGLSNLDFASGIIDLSSDGEPLLDGDRLDDWFNYDPSGNMTIDFGFYTPGDCPSVNAEIVGTDTLCGQEMGRLEARAVADFGPYQWQWSTGDTSTIIQNLTPGNYRLTITDANGCQGEHLFEIVAGSSEDCMTTSVEANDVTEVKIYPNPMSEVLYVQNNTKDNVQIELWNLTGSRLRTVRVSDLRSLDVSELAAGVYVTMAKDYDGQVLAMEKIIKL